MQSITAQLMARSKDTALALRNKTTVSPTADAKLAPQKKNLMTEIITPSGRTLVELKHAAKNVVALSGIPPRQYLNFIASRELGSYAPRLEEAGWSDLLRACWRLDPDRLQFSSYSSKRGSLQTEWTSRVAVTWEEDLPPCPVSLWKTPEGRSALQIRQQITRKSAGVYTLENELSEEGDTTLYPPDDVSWRFLGDDPKLRASGLMRLASRMRQSAKDNSATLVVDDLAALEMQCADLELRWNADRLFMHGSTSGLDGFFAVYRVRRKGIPSAEDSIAVLHLDEKEMFSVVQFNLSAWNAMMAGFGPASHKVLTLEDCQVHVPIPGDKLEEIRKALLGSCRRETKHVFEKAAWLWSLKPNFTLAETVANIAQGKSKGWSNFDA